MIEVKDLRKSYGKKEALKGVSFNVNVGEIVGFLGPNGAGKSTAMNIIAGYLSSNGGSVSIDGHDILSDAENAKKNLGYLPEAVPLYPDMTVDEYLSFIFELKKCAFNKKEHLNEICNAVKITDVRSRLIKNISKGYKQRVGIAQALIGDPKLIILDEPTVGLDPKQIVEIRNLIRILGHDHAVILSTHILSEVQAVCDRTIIIKNGKIVANEPTDDISNLVGGARRLKATVMGDAESVEKAFLLIEGVVKVTRLASKDAQCNDYIVECDKGVDARRNIFDTVCNNRWVLLGLENLGMKLEDVFLALTDRKKKKSSAGGNVK